MKVCIITDNDFIFENFKRIVEERKKTDLFDFFYSITNRDFILKYGGRYDFKPLSLKDVANEFYDKYNLFISLHCKQIFPKELVCNHRCINVHPGLNPYNRGWYPQVFSILNKLPAGVTIHEMDDELDHGKIIYQEQIEIYDFETSYDVYRKIQETEIRLIEEKLDNLLDGKYSAKEPCEEGNINYKSDFTKLCALDLNQVGTFREFIDILRATTFEKYNNAYFFDSNGNKIYVSVNLKKEER